MPDEQAIRVALTSLGVQNGYLTKRVLQLAALHPERISSANASMEASELIEVFAGTSGGGSSSSGIDLNVKSDFNAKGDVKYLHDAGITTGTNLLSSPTAAFVGSDVGKSVNILGAGPLWNARGAWVASTTYAASDTVTKDSLTWACMVPNSSSIWNPVYWEPVWRTRKSLGAWIKQVNAGVATLVTTVGGSTPANASVTVSGGDFYYGTDDSVAFQAFADAIYNAGGGRGIVPLGDYIVMNVDWRSNTNIEVTTGTRFRLPGIIPFGPALFYMSGSLATRDQNMRFGSEGICLFDFTGVDPINFMHGVFAGAIEYFKIEGIYMLNSPDGNAVTTYPTGSNNLAPSKGIIERIYSKNSPWGFGPVQLDAGSDMIVRNIWSDLGRGVNCETDDAGPPKVLERVQIQGVTLESRASILTYPQSAIGLISHAQTMRDITVRDVYGTGSADGVLSSADTATSLDHILIDNVRVTGGGRGHLCLSTDVRFNDYTIRNVKVDGSAIFNPFAGAYDPGINYAPGMNIQDCRVDGGLGPGYQAIFQGTNKQGTAKFARCKARGNTIGWDNRYLQRLELDSCDAEDNPVTGIPFFTDAQLDLTTGAGNWLAPAGTTATRVVGTNRYIKLVSNGTTSAIDVSTPTGTSGYPVVAGSFYQFSGLGQGVVGTLQELRLQILWYTGAGAGNGTSTGAVVTMNGSTAVSSFFSVQAPASSAFASVKIQCLHNGGGTNFTNLDEVRMIPLQFGKVASVGGTQTYGVKGAQGVDVVLTNTTLWGNTFGRVDTSGSPLTKENIPRDILVIS